MTEPLLSVRDLRTYFRTHAGLARAVDDVSFEVQSGETLGIVGESGCGKSVTALSLLRLIQPPGRIEPGSHVTFEGQDLMAVGEEAMRRVRGNRIAMIFQEPMTSLNPVFTVGDQIAEVARIHQGASRRQAWDRAVEIAGQTRGLSEPSPTSSHPSAPARFARSVREVPNVRCRHRCSQLGEVAPAERGGIAYRSTGYPLLADCTAHPAPATSMMRTIRMVRMDGTLTRVSARQQ